MQCCVVSGTITIKFTLLVAFGHLSQVGNLKDIYHFVLPKTRFDSEMKGKSISDLKPLYTVTETLKQEEKVIQTKIPCIVGLCG